MSRPIFDNVLIKFTENSKNIAHNIFYIEWLDKIFPYDNIGFDCMFLEIKLRIQKI
jgi:hypothetical protein